MSAGNPADWMWAQACEMIAQAERMHRQFFRLATSEQTQPVWEPPVDVFEDEREVIIVVALPGVPTERIEVTIEGSDLVVRAERRPPFAGARHALRRLEIPYGYFERRVRLPEARLVTDMRESLDGCLVLRLRKTG